MQQNGKKPFHSKFCLLNSQEYNDDIKWTSSSSGEYENTPYEKLCYLDKNKNRKRKRKKKVLKNLSNLSITIIDPKSKDSKSDIVLEKSPILKSKRLINATSPIFVSNCPPQNETSATSPILPIKSFKSKSPIIQLKTASPRCSARVRKKLSYDKDNCKEISNIKSSNGDKGNKINIDQKNEIIKDKFDNICIKSESNSMSTLTDSGSSLKAKLVERVKYFLDSNFSSENTSQNISDTSTPKDDSKSEEIEILSCKTQTVFNPQTVKLESASSSDTSCLDKNVKKIKYKKGGLAYRLNALLKKQNAQINLWQHERFLANNSNFVIPKEKHIVFRIQNIEFKYGCYLLSAIDLDCKKYYVLINKKYVNVNLNVDFILKLYEPYTILPDKELDKSFKIIVGVCKFECVSIEH